MTGVKTPQRRESCIGAQPRAGCCSGILCALGVSCTRVHQGCLATCHLRPVTRRSNREPGPRRAGLRASLWRDADSTRCGLPLSLQQASPACQPIAAARALSAPGQAVPGFACPPLLTLLPALVAVQVRLLRVSANRGKGHAVKRGMLAARGGGHALALGKGDRGVLRVLRRDTGVLGMLCAGRMPAVRAVLCAAGGRPRWPSHNPARRPNHPANRSPQPPSNCPQASTAY
jgi:hypothetical protein